MKRGLLQSLAWAIPNACLLAAYLVASETLHLTNRNPFFLAEMGSTLLPVVVWYLVFALALGIVVGLALRTRRMQAFVFAAVGYTLVSLKIFWIDATMLANPPIAVAFALFTCGWFSAAAIIVRRFALPDSFPILLTVGYANVCFAIAAGWGLGGGRLLPFLLAPRTIIFVLAGLGGVGAMTLLQRWLEQRSASWASLVVPLAILVSLTSATLVTRRSLPSGNHAHATDSTARGPDIYVVSFDALRTDAFKAFIASHPSSNLARLSQQATMFENVVSQGPSTEGVLAANTFAGAATTDCGPSIPNQLAERGYFTAMIYGGLGKRFEGSDCYEYFFSGEGASLIRRYSLPALARVLTHRERALRAGALRADDLLEKLAAVAAAPEPVYAYLHFLELHAPYVPDSKRDDRAYDATLREFMRRCYIVACDPNDPSNAKLIETVRNAYVELMDAVDVAVGRAYEIAKQRKRDFIFVITGDHGELFGEHGGFAHGGGFVGELLDIPFLVVDSRNPQPRRRCELMLSSEAVHETVVPAVAGHYPDHAQLDLVTPPLGRAWINKQTQTIRYELSDKVVPQAGTWRNIHRSRTGELPYPIERCDETTAATSPQP